MDKRHARFAKAGGLILLGLAAWIFAKPITEYLASRAIGHPVEIHGKLRLFLFPQPGLSATRITVAAPDWSARRHMLSVARLSVALDPGALLRGRLVLDEARLVKPELYVERTAQGRLNWGQEAGKKDATGQEAGKSGVSVPNLPLVRKLVVDDGNAVFYDHTRGRIAATLNHALWRKERSGPGALEARGSIGGRPWDLGLRLVPAAQGGPYQLAMELDAAAFEASAQGKLGWPLADAATDLRLRVEGSGLPWKDKAAVSGPQPVPHYVAGARLQGRGQQWQLSGLRVAVDGNVLQGQLALDARGARPDIAGELKLVTAGHDLAAEVTQLWEQLRSGEDSSLEQLRERLRKVDARLQLAVVPEVQSRADINAIRMELVLADGVLVIDPAVLRTDAGSVLASARIDTRADPMAGRVQAVFDGLAAAPLARLLAPQRPVPEVLRGGRLEGKLALAFTSEQIKQAEASLHYRNRPGTNLRLQLETGEGGEPALRLAARGQVRGTALRVEASGDPLALLQRKATAPFKLEARLGATRIEASGRVMTPDDRLEARLALSGPGSAALGQLLGVKLPQLPSYAVRGQIAVDDGGLVVDDARVRVGSSRFQASGRIDDLSDPTRFQLKMRAGRIVLSDFRAFAGLVEGEGEGGGDDGLPPLSKLDGSVDLRADRVVLAEGALMRKLRLEARLHDGRFVLSTLHADVGGGGIRAEGHIAGLGAQPHGVLNATINDLRLGQILRPLGLEQRLPGILNGKLALAIGKQYAQKTRSSLRYRVPGADTDIRIILRQTSDAILFALRGEYRDEQFRLEGRAAPLRQLWTEGRYPFRMEFVALATHGRIQGSLLRPLEFEGLRSTLMVEGPNPRRTEPVLGFRLPELPPYRLAGPLLRQDGVWTFGPFRGHVGNTDLSGRIVAAFPKGRPNVTARLQSDLLDLDDLGGVVGAAPGAEPGDITSDEQRRKREELDRRGEILPDEPFELDELGRMDALLTYEAKRVEADLLPVGSLSLRLALSDGTLALSPLRAEVAGGEVTLRMRLAAVQGKQPPKGYMEMAIQDVRLAPLAQKLAPGSAARGRLYGYAAFESTGDSVASILSSADGSMRVSLENAALDALLIELAGLDFGEALLHWLGNPGNELYPVRCALVQARLRDGVLDMGGSTLDTTDTRFTMGGQVFFPREKLDLRVEAHPKDFSLFAARTPLLIEGTFRNPNFHPAWPGLAGRLAAAAALAAAAPPAALLAFVEPGLGNSIPCAEAAD